MKFCRILLLLSVMFIIVTGIIPVALAGDVYENTESSVKFVIPDGWEEKPLSKDREYINAKFVNGANFIFFCYQDLWKLADGESYGITREEVNNSYLSETDIEGMYGSGMVTTEEYGGIEYYIWNGTMEGSYKSITATLNTIVAIHIQGGYMYIFSYQALEYENAAIEDFHQLLGSVEYSSIESAAPVAVQVTATESNPVAATPVVNTSVAVKEAADPVSNSPAVQETYNVPKASSYTTTYSDTSLPTAGGLFLSLIITVVVYSLPIIIYRYGIRKRPMEKKVAKKLTIFYGIAAFILMTIIDLSLGGDGIVGGAIIFWSFINYSMLTKGMDKMQTAEFYNVKRMDTVSGSTPESGENMMSGKPKTDTEGSYDKGYRKWRNADTNARDRGHAPHKYWRGE